VFRSRGRKGKKGEKGAVSPLRQEERGGRKWPQKWEAAVGTRNRGFPPVEKGGRKEKKRIPNLARRERKGRDPFEERKKRSPG